MMTRIQAQAIATAVAALRPGWDHAGIVAALGKCKDHDDPFAVATAAIIAASDATNRTPAVIPLAGRHWLERPADVVPHVGPGREPRCEIHHYELARACRCCASERLAPTPDILRPTPTTEPPQRRPMPRVPTPDPKETP